MKNRIIYISNVDIEGTFLPGVINKIRGQRKAFIDAGFEMDILYPTRMEKIVLNSFNGERVEFKGGRKTYIQGNLLSKFLNHFSSTIYGSINFNDCFNKIVKNNYDAIYLRFFLPGKDLITFLSKIRKSNPQIIILLEYPTKNIKELFSTTVVRRISYRLNLNFIKKMNQMADYIITLTDDKELFCKPTIFMPNGIDLNGITPVPVPGFKNQLILMGVASDCAFYHGFDKIIRGISLYKKDSGRVNVLLRIISNPLSNNVENLKNLANELGVKDNVSFEITKTRNELAVEYTKVHLGVGTLALHRIGLMNNYSLKHREYAAFGIPFIMSKGDDQFEDSEFVFTTERDEEPIPIASIINFYLALKDKYVDYPSIFRRSIEEKISWQESLKGVFQVLRKE